ncbi:acyltransferase domain-containing protein, partial [Kibdelosporangium lantanae]
MRAVAERRSAAGVVQGSPREPGLTTFVFPGQGSQHVGMGRDLHRSFPTFAAALDRVLAELDLHVAGLSLRDVMWGDDEELLQRTEFAQPALFAVEVALFELLESLGVSPDVVTGHSVGEIAALHVAGAVSLPDACALVTARGRLMQDLPDGGAMVAIGAGAEEVTEVMAKLPGCVALAAVNGPKAVVVSGEEQAVLRVAEHFAGAGHRTRRLAVSHAFHSPLMELMVEELCAIAKGLSYSEPQIPVVSSVDGSVIGEAGLGDTDHWRRHTCDAVLFGSAVDQCLGMGTTTFVEVGPGSALTTMVEQCVPTDGDTVVVPLARRDHAEDKGLLLALAALFTHGLNVDWTAVVGP